MRHASRLLVVAGLLAGAWLMTRDAEPVHAQQGPAVQWIWFDEGNPAQAAPAETRYFRKVFNIDRPIQKVVDEAELDLTADNEFTVWVNGTLVGKGTDWKRVYRFDVQKLMVHGRNVIAVEAKNTEGPAGLLVRLGYVPNGQDKRAVASDGSWKASKTAGEPPALAGAWRTADFDDSKWSAVKVIGPYGQAGPWKNVVWDAGGNDRFTVPPGFAVEMVVPPNPTIEGLEVRPGGPNEKRPRGKEVGGPLPFSLINLTFDAKGRLMVSQERGPILLCTEPDKNGVFQKIRPYCEQVRNCQGMCWVKDALLLVGDGPQGTGLYRVKDTDADDKTDEVKLVHKFQGGMGEHGPHAIIHGPDDWLYLVVGNHAFVQIGPEIAKNGANPEKLAANSPLTRWPHGTMGPDQGKPGTTEDVLLPRLNDSRGHAADMRAPGGTIWRLDHEGKNISLVTAGFRNHYDATFSPTGELFTFDSDMEWDEGLPWYRAVRVCHCPPGADFVWRTGAANTPDYYIDSLPPVVETGRGSPVGVEYYDHTAFPEKYRTLYLADWAIGVIFAVHLERDGASYKGKAERFCTGAPMNVTDIAAGPDGGLYFTLGGRGTQGGVFRIVYRDIEKGVGWAPPWFEQATRQPLASWTRAKAATTFRAGQGKELLDTARKWSMDATSAIMTPSLRRGALDLLQRYGDPPDAAVLCSLARDRSPELRAHAIYLLGVNGYKEGREILVKALNDGDALVRRRACEALIRANMQPPVEAIWPLLKDKDRFVRTAARLVLQRIDPSKWVDRLWKEPDEHVVLQAVVALCKTNQAAPDAVQIFERLHKGNLHGEVQDTLDLLRVVQLAMIHTTQRPGSLRAFAEQCENVFPHKDWRVNRELAILLTQFRREKIVIGAIHGKLLEALLESKDRQQQIHYFYCLRLLHEDWTPEQKDQLLAWYDSTKTWSGGHSFTPFLENILRDLNPIFSGKDRARIIAQADKLPWAAVAMLRMSPPEQLPQPEELAALYERLIKTASLPKLNEMKEIIINALARSSEPEAQAAMRKIGDIDPAQRDVVARGLARFPSEDNYPYLLRGLQSPHPPVLLDVIRALRDVPKKPKADDPGPYRALLMASRRLDAKDRWKVVELLRHWGNKKFGADEGDWQPELAAWSKWFVQSFPAEPPLPDVTIATTESKYKFKELLAYLETDPKGKTGDVMRGRKVFEKTNCIKCHKFGNEGEGIGPDLTTLKNRFKRADMLESLLHPSKVISDQYRGVVIETKGGETITGLAAPQGNTITVLKLDGTKVTLKTDDIQVQFASTVSAMPDKLLDELTLQEIADLFAYLESEPPK